MNTKELSLTGHLDELRSVLLTCLVIIPITAAVAYFAFGDQLFALFTRPLSQYDVELVFIGMAEAFLTKIKIAVLVGFFLALPVILWRIWQFVAPGLFRHERRMILIVFPLSLLLFAAGVAFAYLVVFNFAARFLLVVVSKDLVPMLSVGKYISFLISFIVPFGLVFQLPMVVYFLARIGLVEHTWLAQNRKVALLIMVTVGAVLTPPDIISQLLLAGPMLLLYEVGIVVARVTRPRAALQAQTEGET